MDWARIGLRPAFVVENVIILEHPPCSSLGERKSEVLVYVLLCRCLLSMTSFLSLLRSCYRYNCTNMIGDMSAVLDNVIQGLVILTPMTINVCGREAVRWHSPSPSGQTTEDFGYVTQDFHRMISISPPSRWTRFQRPIIFYIIRALCQVRILLFRIL